MVDPNNATGAADAPDQSPPDDEIIASNPYADLATRASGTVTGRVVFDVETHKIEPGSMYPHFDVKPYPEIPGGASHADHVVAHALMNADSDEHADDAEIVRQLMKDLPDEPSETYEPPGAAVSPHITAEFINTTLRNVRAPFEAKMKRGKLYKAQRTKLTKQADDAVREFRGAYLSELTDEQALRISLGITGLVGDSMQGFRYLDASEE